MPQIRDYFPGNNTPVGFFSYYEYIMSQDEGKEIICIKGGPGTGKSTFMKKVAFAALDRGEDVDFLHCSADNDSIDGIILKNKRIALIDGTSPHVTDPITPGAIDKIIDLGQCWNKEVLKEKKYQIMRYNKLSSKWYETAYGYLAACGKIYEALSAITNRGIEKSDIYRVTELILNRELSGEDIAFKEGRVKKFFASAITPSGIENHLKSLLLGMKKIYFVNGILGYENKYMFERLLEGIRTRGFDAECFYCSMNPKEKIEHIIVPSLSLAFVTCNKWHDVEPWEVSEKEGKTDVIMIDLNDYVNNYYMEQNRIVIGELVREMDELLKKSISALKEAKENHKMVEELYIASMDFNKVSAITEKEINELLNFCK